MPQTKPMAWIKILILMNLLSLMLLIKMFQSKNMKKMNPKTKTKIKFPMMKW